MQYVTWDIGIVTAFALLLAYCLLIKPGKSLAALVGVYVAYCMASIWGERVTAFFSGDRVFLNQVWIKANASTYTTQAWLLIIITILLTMFAKLAGKRSRYSSVEVTLYVLSTICLMVVFLLSFMSPTFRTAVLDGSRIVPILYGWREWILSLPVFMMVFFGIYGGED